MNLQNLCGRPIEMWVVDCCHEKLQKFLTGQSQDQKIPAFWSPAHSGQEKRPLRRVPFGVTTHQISRTQMRELQIHKNFGFHILNIYIHPLRTILSYAEKCVEFNGMIIFQFQAEMRELSAENFFVAWLSRIDARCHYRSLVFQPRVGFWAVRIDPLHFLAGCRKRQLNQALSVQSLSLGFF